MISGKYSVPVCIICRHQAMLLAEAKKKDFMHMCNVDGGDRWVVANLRNLGEVIEVVVCVLLDPANYVSTQ